MRISRIILRHPLIKFAGRRRNNQPIDHTPRVHPESPESTLPTSFAAYRQNAQTHGPLGGKGSSNVDRPFVVEPGQIVLRNQLPRKYQYRTISDAEIDNVMAGGADIVY